MKPLFWVGLVVLVLGVASLFVAVPRRENKGVKMATRTSGFKYSTANGFHRLLA
jgi:hypothetical protein